MLVREKITLAALQGFWAGWPREGVVSSTILSSYPEVWAVQLRDAQITASKIGSGEPRSPIVGGGAFPGEKGTNIWMQWQPVSSGLGCWLGLHLQYISPLCYLTW